MSASSSNTSKKPAVSLAPLNVSASNAPSTSSNPSPVSPHWKAVKLDILKRTAVNAFVDAAPAPRTTTPGPVSSGFSRLMHRAPKPAPAVHQRTDAELFKQELIALKSPQFNSSKHEAPTRADRKGKARAVASVSSLRDVSLDGRDQLRALVRLM